MEQIIITYAGSQLPYDDISVINEIVKRYCTDPAREVTIDVCHNCGKSSNRIKLPIEVETVRHMAELVIDTSVENIPQRLCDYIIEKDPYVIRFIDGTLSLDPIEYYGKIRDSLSGTRKDTTLALMKFKKIKENEKLLKVLRDAYGNKAHKKNKAQRIIREFTKKTCKTF